MGVGNSGSLNTGLGNSVSGNSGFGNAMNYWHSGIEGFGNAVGAEGLAALRTTPRAVWAPRR